MMPSPGTFAAFCTGVACELVTTTDQMVFVAGAFVIIAAITAVVQLRWLRIGRVQRVITFVCGVLAMLCLWASGLPPSWFAASWAAFVLIISLLLWAFVLRGTDERSFGVPLLLGMGLTLLVANVVALVKRVS